MANALVLIVALCAALSSCDSRRASEQEQLARFPGGDIVEDGENPGAPARCQRDLPESLLARVPLLGRGVCVPLEVARPDGAHDTPRWGKWTYEYVKTTQSTSPTGQPLLCFGMIEDTSLGIESQGEYQNNSAEGPWTFWHPNGHKHAEGSFTHGKMTGPWKFWLEDGAVDAIQSGVYENNALKAPGPPK